MDGTILVADDDRTIRTVLTQALTRAGCKVHATSSLVTLMRWVEEGKGEVRRKRPLTLFSCLFLRVCWGCCCCSRTATWVFSRFVLFEDKKIIYQRRRKQDRKL